MGRDGVSTFHDVGAVISVIEEVRRTTGAVAEAAETIAATQFAAGFAGRDYSDRGEMIVRGFALAADVSRSWARATARLSDAVEAAVASSDAVDRDVAADLSAAGDPVVPR